MRAPKFYKNFEEIPMFSDSSRRYTPWIVAFLAFLFVVILSITLFLGQSNDRWTQKVSERLTLRISNVQSGPETVDVFKKITQSIEKIPGVNKAEVLDQQKMLKLLDPWLPNADLLKDIKLPILIDVELSPKLSQGEFSKKLEGLIPSFHIESFSKWQDSLSLFVKSIRLIALLMSSFILGAILIIIILVTRSTLLSHKPLVKLLRLMGAKDSYLASILQKQCFRICLMGCLLGGAIAAPVIYGFSFILNNFGIPDLFYFSITFYELSVIFGIIVAMCIFCAYVARFTAGRLLKTIDNDVS